MQHPPNVAGCYSNSLRSSCVGLMIRDGPPGCSLSAGDAQANVSAALAQDTSLVNTRKPGAQLFVHVCISDDIFRRFTSNRLRI